MILRPPTVHAKDLTDFGVLDDLGELIAELRSLVAPVALFRGVCGDCSWATPLTNDPNYAAGQARLHASARNHPTRLEEA